MQFRSDINGLRAIAVIAVVLFHFNSSWLSGGFAGVDVFFVISGFLMTGIIFRGLEQECFSISKFYAARAKRIVPALSVLVIVCLVIGYAVLSPVEYLELNKHAVGSISFISNFIYWTEAGYFDSASGSKWLLHTWSLSVEWQFYILYPIVLVCLKRFMTLNQIKMFILTGAFLGFLLSVYSTTRWPSLSYYLLPTRAWEMMFGGLAYIYPLSFSNNRISLYNA